MLVMLDHGSLDQICRRTPPDVPAASSFPMKCHRKELQSANQKLVRIWELSTISIILGPDWWPHSSLRVDNCLGSGFCVGRWISHESSDLCISTSPQKKELPLPPHNIWKLPAGASDPSGNICASVSRQNWWHLNMIVKSCSKKRILFYIKHLATNWGCRNTAM